MGKAAKCLTVGVLVLWGLATMHCDFEQVPGLNFLAWCHSDGDHAQQTTGCDDDLCWVVESGLYKVEEPTLAVPAPLWTANFLPMCPEPCSPSSAFYPTSLNTPQPDLARTWQFSYRTALPARAPSLSLV